MGWQDPNGPWVRAVRRRERMLTFSLAAIIVLPLGAMGYLAWTMMRIAPLPMRSPWLLVPYAVFPVSVLLIAVFTGYQLRRLRKIRRRVPQHDGRVCPRCYAVLPDAESETPCPGCGRGYTTAAVREWWEDFAFVPIRARRWRGVRRAQTEQAVSLVRRQVRRNLIAFPPTVVLLVLMYMWMMKTSLLGALVRSIPLLLMMELIGVASVLTLYAKERKGESRHCPNCDYQQAPTGAPSDRCPECGTPWAGAGATVRGRRVAAAWAMPVAIGIFIAAFAANGSAQWWMLGGGLTVRLLPTDTLLHDAAFGQSFTNAEWTEVNRRTLTPEQEQRLASLVLDARSKEGSLDTGAETWFAAQLAAGTLPRPIVERYYRERFTAWLAAPETAHLGETFEVSVDARFAYEGSRPNTREFGVYIGGFYVGDDPEPRERHDRPHYASLVDNEPRPYDRSFDPAKYTPRLECTPKERGPLRIRFVYWYVVGTGSVSVGTITWNADGTPTIPANAEWSERRELECVVRVE